MRNFIFITGLIIILYGCHDKSAITEYELNEWFEEVSNFLREGDLVFRKGIGIASQMVITAGGGSEVYSHIGIVVCKDDSSGWYVCHAVPGESESTDNIDRVKCEPLESFFSIQKASHGKIVRICCADSIANIAANTALEIWQKEVPFDHNYDLMDTTSFYCTQLVVWVYAQLNIDLIEDRNHPARLPGFNGIYIFPSDIDKSKYLTNISYY